MPAVLMKIPSPLPRSTTLVSPVTMETPQASAACPMEAQTRQYLTDVYEDEIGELESLLQIDLACWKH